MNKELELTKDIIISYLSKSPTPEGINTIYEICHGNDKELLGHINALISIFETARDELVKEHYERNKNGKK